MRRTPKYSESDRNKRLSSLVNADPDLFIVRLNRLVDEFYDKGFTLDRISKDCGYARDTIASYLRGERMPNARTLLSLCNYLNVSADWILGLSDERRTVW